MHLIVPFAAPLSPAGRDALAALATPELDVFVGASHEVARDAADEHTPTPPHERALARALGWPADAATPLPWAARAARNDGIEVGSRAWGLLTPVHWRVGADAVHLAHPLDLDLDEPTSRALFDALRPWFESEGFALAWGAPLRWYAAHACLANLVTASLDRAIGRNVDGWLPAQPEAKLIRRLQNEVQMLLYTQALNAEREARGAAVVNSFWLSGCGTALSEATVDVRIDDRLARPALAEDWPAWRDAWARLDADVIARQAFTQLTLCGERASVTLVPRAPSAWQRLRGMFAAPRGAARSLLEGL